MHSQKCQIAGKDQLSCPTCSPARCPALSRATALHHNLKPILAIFFWQLTLIVCCLYGNQESSVIIYISSISILPYYFFPVNSDCCDIFAGVFCGQLFPNSKQCDEKQKRLQYANILNVLLKRPLGTDVP